MVKNKNGGPDLQQKDLSSQLQWRRQFRDGKSDLNKTQVYAVVATEFMEPGRPSVGGNQGGTHNMG